MKIKRYLLFWLSLSPHHVNSFHFRELEFYSCGEYTNFPKAQSQFTIHLERLSSSNAMNTNSVMSIVDRFLSLWLIFEYPLQTVCISKLLTLVYKNSYIWSNDRIMRKCLIFIMICFNHLQNSNALNRRTFFFPSISQLKKGTILTKKLFSP